MSDHYSFTLTHTGNSTQVSHNMAAAPELSAPILEVIKSYSMNISMFPYDVSVTINKTYKIFLQHENS